jgi:hypothetical protein
MAKDPTAKAAADLRVHVQKTLRKEFTAFFTTMTTEQPNGWPAIAPQDFVDALADSLIEMGKASGKNQALLQTLVFELQDRISK